MGHNKPFGSVLSKSLIRKTVSRTLSFKKIGPTISTSEKKYRKKSKEFRNNELQTKNVSNTGTKKKEIKVLYPFCMKPKKTINKHASKKYRILNFSKSNLPSSPCSILSLQRNPHTINPYVYFETSSVRSPFRIQKRRKIKLHRVCSLEKIPATSSPVLKSKSLKNSLSEHFNVIKFSQHICSSPVKPIKYMCACKDQKILGMKSKTLPIIIPCPTDDVTCHNVAVGSNEPLPGTCYENKSTSTKRIISCICDEPRKKKHREECMKHSEVECQPCYEEFIKRKYYKRKDSRCLNILKYILFAFIIIVWSPCIIMITLCWCITYPLKPTEGEEPISRTCEGPIYVSQTRSITDRFQYWFKKGFLPLLSECPVSGKINVKSIRIIHSLLKKKKQHGPRVHRELSPCKSLSLKCFSKHHPSRSKKYTMYFDDNRGWLIKPLLEGGDNNYKFTTEVVQRADCCLLAQDRNIPSFSKSVKFAEPPAQKTFQSKKISSRNTSPGSQRGVSCACTHDEMNNAIQKTKSTSERRDSSCMCTHNEIKNKTSKSFSKKHKTPSSKAAGSHLIEPSVQHKAVSRRSRSLTPVTHTQARKSRSTSMPRSRSLTPVIHKQARMSRSTSMPRSRSPSVKRPTRRTVSQVTEPQKLQLRDEGISTPYQNSAISPIPFITTGPSSSPIPVSAPAPCSTHVPLVPQEDRKTLKHSQSPSRKVSNEKRLRTRPTNRRRYPSPYYRYPPCSSPSYRNPTFQRQIVCRNKTCKLKTAKERKTPCAEKIRDCWQGILYSINRAEDNAWEKVDCNNLYVNTLRRRPCYWIFCHCPSLYPYFLDYRRHVHNFCHVILFISTACIWCPLILCFYVCLTMFCDCVSC